MLQFVPWPAVPHSSDKGWVGFGLEILANPSAETWAPRLVQLAGKAQLAYNHHELKGLYWKAIAAGEVDVGGDLVGEAGCGCGWIRSLS